MINPLHARTTSGFVLSIATGLAMESLFTPRQQVYDPERVTPPRIPLFSYDELWVNVLTLIRNAYNALPKEAIRFLQPEHMVEVIHQEMELIKDLLRHEGQDLVKPVFYFNNYEQLLPPNSKVFQRRQDTTAIQRQARHIYDVSKKLLIRETPEIKVFHLELSNLGKSAIIFTHIPADLLSYRRFGKLDLLESHSGKLKPKPEWGTKYYPVPEEDMARLPFCRQLLSALGDHVMIIPLPIRARRLIMECSKKSRWTPLTNPSAVNADLSRINDPFLVSTLKTLSLY